MRCFVPGVLTNPMNGSHGHWDKHRRWAKGWREKASLYMLHAWGRRHGVDPKVPKRVTFTAYVGAEWDDDNLRAGLKPTRDALKDMLIVHDDKPSAGHVFEYAQKIERSLAKRGVQIEVEVL
jgi:hypothetical protein